MVASSSVGYVTPEQKYAGWGKAIRLPYYLVPFTPLVKFLVYRRRDLDALTSVRILFLHHPWMLLFLLGATRFFLRTSKPTPLPLWMTLIFYAYVGVALIGLVFWSRRALVATSETTLLESYRSAVMIGTGLAMAPSLLGILGVLLSRSTWPYLVLGFGTSALGLLLIAPTRGEIARREGQLARSASQHSLHEVLRRPLPDGQEARRAREEIRMHYRQRGMKA